MIKRLLLTFLSLSSLAAHADAHTQTSFVKGPFLGLSVGVGQLNTRVTEFYAVGQTRNFRHAAPHMTEGLHLGWGTPFGDCGSWYGGILGEANLSSLKGKETSMINISFPALYETTSSQERYNFAVALKMGRVICGHTLLFLRAGVRFSTFKFMQQFTLSGTNLSPFSSSPTMAGIEPGIGVSTRIANNLTFNAEYMYAFYGTKKFSAVGSPLFQISTNATMRPQIGRFMAGFTYHFF